MQNLDSVAEEMSELMSYAQFSILSRSIPSVPVTNLRIELSASRQLKNRSCIDFLIE